MQFARDFQIRLQRAATLKAHPWVCALALMAGALAAHCIVFLTPVNRSDVAAARALGIVSVSVRAGYSKSADSLAYALALTGAITTSLAIWSLWAVSAGRNEAESTPSAPTRTSGVTFVECGIVALAAFALFGRFWNGRAATFSAWSALVEEGEMLAWIDTVLRGGALFRDAFCLYGPLSIWPVALLYSIFPPSLGLWRTWIFALNAPALFAVYLLLRRTTRTRLAAGAGAVIIAVLCAGGIPAMSWTLSRVGLGLAALAALTWALDRGTRRWHVATGALSAVALLYSQEVGIACAFAVTGVLLLRAAQLRFALVWTAVGAAAVLAPATVYLAVSNALSATVDDLFLFPRIRMLGFAAYPFPRFALNAETLRAYFVPAVLAVSGFSTATKFLRGLRDARVFTEVALFIFGALLFTAALSRPDDIHVPFVAPPALILLVAMMEDAYFALWSREHRVPATAALVLGAAALLPWRSIAQENVLSLIQVPSGRTLALPRGGSALLPDEFARDLDEVTRAIQSRTSPNEPFWVFPNEALLYFLADRPQPTHFCDALFAVTRQQREQLIADLERTQPRWAVVYRDAPEVDGIPYGIALPEVVAYLNEHYEVESNIGAFIFMRRKS